MQRVTREIAISIRRLLAAPGFTAFDADR